MRRGSKKQRGIGFLADEVVFLKLAGDDFTQATYAFGQVDDHREDGDKELVRFLMLSAIIMYARPFTESKGRDRKSHFLPAKQCVPESLRSLHDDLLACRNQFFAHSDVGAHKPRLIWTDSLTGNNISGYSKFIAQVKSRRPDEFIPRIDDVLACINAARRYIRMEKQQVEAEIESVLMAKGIAPPSH